MKGFYWGKGAVRCGFCGIQGHNITTCNLINTHANNALKKIENTPSYVCSPSEHKALVELSRREERREKLRKPKSPPRCSYCRGLGHKRPKCQLLKDLRQLVYKANKNWKRIFTQRVNEVGAGIGSLIRFDNQVSYNLDFNIDPNQIAMITDYNLNTLNVFCSLGGYSEYQGNSMIRVLSGEHADSVSVKYLSYLLGNDLLHQGWWFSNSSCSVLSPMSWKPDKEWLDSEWDEVFDWFFKSAKYDNLISDGIISFLEKWADKK
jgi:hypothetical protein